MLIETCNVRCKFVKFAYIPDLISNDNAGYYIEVNDVKLIRVSCSNYKYCFIAPLFQNGNVQVGVLKNTGRKELQQPHTSFNSFY